MNEKVLNKLDSTYYPVLIDHAYNTIDIYEGVNGLDYDACLGSDYRDWFDYSLFTFLELNEYELKEFSSTHQFSLVSI